MLQLLTSELLGLYSDGFPTILVDLESHNIIHANAIMEQMFGYYMRDALDGKPLSILLPDRFRVQHEAHLSAYLADPRRRPMGKGKPLFGLRNDGTEFPIVILLAGAIMNGKPIAIGIVGELPSSDAKPGGPPA